ncbi:MAG TPA: DUF6325 family protein [Candidatus Limnocylindrales bacterium]
MGIGPVEYMVVAFPGNQFKGEVAPALRELVENGTIRIIDLAFVNKDGDGDVVAIELEDSGSEIFQAFDALAAERGGLINHDDLMDIGGALEPNSSAAILVWEDVWATRLKDAIVGAGGVMIDIRRVPYDVVEAAIAWRDANAVEA